MERKKTGVLLLTLIVTAAIFFVSCWDDDEKVNDQDHGHQEPEDKKGDNNDEGNGEEIEHDYDITYGSVTDIDNNVYKTVVIGNQEWMAENLRVSRYNDGTEIPKVADDDEWGELTTGAYCWYDNNSQYDIPYGKLYNWYAVDTGILCPQGWHVPSNDDWTDMVDYLGGIRTAGGKLKHAGTKYWESPNSDATNETGFTALPGGYRYYESGSFNYMGRVGRWWTKTDYSKSGSDQEIWANDRTMFNGSGGVGTSLYLHKKNGASVRCIKQ